MPENNAPDVSQLSREDFPKADFPASGTRPFRVFFDRNSHAGIAAHAKEDTSVEICGVLVGNWKQDDDGPYAEILNFIRCDNATSKFAEVTFTHDSWTFIHNEMDAKYPDARILGWYHSHPDFGIFLSEPDVFIHRNFFDSPGQIAYVVDPVRELEGVFQWQAGQPQAMPHYSVGDRIVTIDSSVTKSVKSTTTKSQNEASDFDERVAAPRSETSLLTLVLGSVCLFLVGYLFASWGNAFERKSLAEGVVAHYGFNKLIRVGLDSTIVEIQNEIARVSQEAATVLATPPPTEGDEAIKNDSQRRAKVLKRLIAVHKALEVVKTRYAFSDSERAALQRYEFVADKVRELETGQKTVNEFDLKQPTSKPIATDAKSTEEDRENANSTKSDPSSNDQKKQL